LCWLVPNSELLQACETWEHHGSQERRSRQTQWSLHPRFSPYNLAFPSLSGLEGPKVFSVHVLTFSLQGLIGIGLIVSSCTDYLLCDDLGNPSSTVLSSRSTHINFNPGLAALVGNSIRSGSMAEKRQECNSMALLSAQ
jgi:hypothetical protein